MALHAKEIPLETLNELKEVGRSYNPTKTGINGLPVEILGVIFLNAVACDEGREATPIVLSAVCSHWRAVVLKSASLWSTIDLTGLTLKQVKGYVGRSGTAPLDIVHSDIFQRPAASRGILSSVLSRIRNLEVGVPAGGSVASQGDISIIEFLVTDPHSTVPMLERYTCDLENLSTGLSVITLPLLGGRTPALRHLKLIDTRMPWSRGFYCNLHTIEIRGCFPGRQSAKDEDICHLFRDCPHLHEFDVSFGRLQWLTSPNEGDERLLFPHPPVPVPHLRRLRLSAPLDYIHHILSSIVADTLHELSLTIDNNIRDEDEAQRQARTALSLPALLPPSALFPLDTIHTRWAGGNRKQTGYIQGFNSANQSSQADAPQLDINWSFSDTRTIADPDSDLFLALARTMRRHMKPVVSQTLSYVSYYPSPTPIRVPLLLDAFTHDWSIEKDLLRGEGVVGPTLQTLELENCRLNLDEMFAMLEWCKNQSSLRDLILHYIVVRAPGEADVMRLKERLDRCEWETRWEGCRFAFPPTVPEHAA